MVEAVAILRAAGHRAAPIPLPETMLARWLCAATGIDAPPGVAVYRAGGTGRSCALCAGAMGRASRMPSLSSPGHRCASPAATGCSFHSGTSLAGEPRDVLTAIDGGHAAPLPNAVSAELVRGVGALLRAAQMAGAMEAALDLATTYANDRVQFGRPIGKFQAIQQQLALLAEEAAAALVASKAPRPASPRDGGQPNSRSPPRRSAPARRPASSPRSRIRCTARSASPRNTPCII